MASQIRALRSLHVLVKPTVSKFSHHVFHLLGARSRGDKQSIWSVHNDNVVKTQNGHETARLRDNDRASAPHSHDVCVIAQHF